MKIPHSVISRLVYCLLYFYSMIRSSGKVTKVFLRSQFFFYKTYFHLVDRLNCLTISWNPEKEFFEVNNSLRSKTISYATICFNLIYFLAASYIFITLILQETENSIVSMAFHFLALAATCYPFLWRSLYVIKAKDLICIMNRIILLEKLHFRSKFIYRSFVNSH